MNKAMLAGVLLCLAGCGERGSSGGPEPGGVSAAEHEELRRRYDKLVEDFNSSSLVQEVERLRDKLDDAEQRAAESAAATPDGLGYRLAEVAAELGEQGFEPETLADREADPRGVLVSLRRRELPALRVQVAGPPANVSELTVVVDAAASEPKKAFSEAAELCVGYGGFDAEQLRQWMANAVTSGEPAETLEQDQRSLAYEHRESLHVFRLASL